MQENINKLITREEAAKILGVKPGSLAVWASTGRQNLNYYKIGRLVKYRYEDVIKFIESRSQNSTGGQDV